MDIPSSVALLLGILFKMLGVLFVTATITWPVLYVMVPLAFVYLAVQVGLRLLPGASLTR